MIRKNIDVFMVQHMQSLAQRYDDSVTMDYKIGALDNRTLMSDCGSNLAIELRDGNTIGRTNVKVSCESTSPWARYVPLTINLYRPVVTAAAPLSRGTNIGAHQLRLRRVNISKLNGSYFSDINEVVGMQNKRSLRADAILLASQLTPPLLVKRGDAVILSARSGALVVKIGAIALRDGHAGEQITVRNKQSKRLVDARVTGPGQVSVNM
jgi:flagella basal body P-ring formation protein FlgA